MIRYGIAWHAMPNDLPPWSAVYQQSRRWMDAGCFEVLASDLRAVLRIASGRRAEPTAASQDDRAEVGRLAAAIQDATDESVELAYVDQGYTGEKPAGTARA